MMLSPLCKGMAALAFSILRVTVAAHDQPYATFHNFMPQDVLEGQDGLPSNGYQPSDHGKITFPLDGQGNGLEMHEAHIYFFEGQYWLYSSEWGCGREGTNFPESSELFGGECGLVTYSSSDLTHWIKRNIYEPNGGQQVYDKPVVMWSPGKNTYIMMYRHFVDNNLWAESSSGRPEGPWVQGGNMTGQYLSHDYDVAIDDNGDAWVASDVFPTLTKDPSDPYYTYDVWVQKLNKDRTGVDTSVAPTLVMKQTAFEGISFFKKGCKWYIMGGPPGNNCLAAITYLFADSPTGPWTNEAGETGEQLKMGTVLNHNGCTGQNKGTSVLPVNRNPANDVVLAGVWEYTTSAYQTSDTNSTFNFADWEPDFPTPAYPTGMFPIAGDLNQAVSGQGFYVLEFEEATGHIKPLSCAADTHIPIYEDIPGTPDGSDPPPRPASGPASPTPNSPPSSSLVMPKTLPPVQRDCRIRSNGTLTVKTTNATGLRNGPSSSTLHFPVFQHPDMQVASATLDADLDITIMYSNGSNDTQTIPRSSIGTSPHFASLTVKPQGATVKGLVLSSEASDGCFGVLAQARDDSGYSYNVNGKELTLAQLWIPSA